MIKCRPHYLPREFSPAILTAVYIQPKASAVIALRQFSDNVTKFENDHPDAVSIVAGEFNHTNMKTILPKYDHMLPVRLDATRFLTTAILQLKMRTVLCHHPTTVNPAIRPCCWCRRTDNNSEAANRLSVTFKTAMMNL